MSKRPIGSLTLEEAEKIGVYKDGCYKFDLSRITLDQFKSLKKSLLSGELHCIKGIGFNQDLMDTTISLAKKKASANPREHPRRLSENPHFLASSCSKTLPNYTRELVSMVSELLSRSESLETLEFKSIPLTYQDVEVLSDAIYKNDELRTLRFICVPLGDSGLERIGRALRKKSVQRLDCRKCGLTDRSASTVSSLLEYHVFVQAETNWVENLSEYSRPRKVCLQKLDLSDNEFSFHFIEDIYNSVINVGLEQLDLRGNPGIPMSLLRQLENEIPSTEFLLGPSPPILPESKPGKKKINSGSSSSLRKKRSSSRVSKTSEKLKQVIRENEELRILVNLLSNSNNLVELESNLYLIGTGAEELASEIKTIDQLFVSNPNILPPFLKASQTKKSVSRKRKVSKSM